MRRPQSVQADYSLGRLTTIKAGGRAEFFAVARTCDELASLLRWAEDSDRAVGVIGSGSNLLVADEGVRGLVLKLEGDLAKIEVEGDRLVCGGGARLPKVAARAAALGMAGLEFGVNIPGSVGGAVKMNANAYGGELGKVLEWADIASAKQVERRLPDQLGFKYRSSNLTASEVVAGASFRLHRDEPDRIKAAMASMRSARRESQPSGIRTFGSTFKNPTDEAAQGRSAGQLLDAAGCRGLQVGGARFSAKHANFVENVEDATTRDVLELMAEGRRRVKARFGVALEPEVRIMGEAAAPADLWGSDDSGG